MTGIIICVWYGFIDKLCTGIILHSEAPATRRKGVLDWRRVLIPHKINGVLCGIWFHELHVNESTRCLDGCRLFRWQQEDGREEKSAAQLTVFPAMPSAGLTKTNSSNSCNMRDMCSTPLNCMHSGEAWSRRELSSSSRLSVCFFVSWREAARARGMDLQEVTGNQKHN